MAEDSYTLNGYTTLDVQEEDGNTSMAVAGIRGVTLIPGVSIERLMTADSIKADSKFQHSAEVQVDIEYALFDQDASIVQQWLAGSGGGTSSSWTDTENPQEFSVDGEFDSVGGDRTLSASVTGITFPEMPIFDGQQDEFATWNLSGTGDDVTDVSMTDNTA